MKIRSRIRTVDDSTRAISSGAISPVNLFPGNATMMYSTGPEVMCSHPFVSEEDTSESNGRRHPDRVIRGGTEIGGRRTPSQPDRHTTDINEVGLGPSRAPHVTPPG